MPTAKTCCLAQVPRQRGTRPSRIVAPMSPSFYPFFLHPSSRHDEPPVIAFASPKLVFTCIRPLPVSAPTGRLLRAEQMTNLLQFNVLRCHRRLDTSYPQSFRHPTGSDSAFRHFSFSFTRSYALCGLVSLNPPNPKTRLSQRRITHYSMTDLCHGTSALQNENPASLMPSPLNRTVTSIPPSAYLPHPSASRLTLTVPL